MSFFFNPFTGTFDYYQPATSGAGDVVGPASSIDNHVAFFSGTTGKLIKDSGLTLSGSNTGDQNLSGYALVSGTLAQFAATSSAQLASVMSDETGTGVLVFGTAPTFTTKITTPIVIGGTASNSDLVLQNTSGGAGTGQVFIKTGNNGAVTALNADQFGQVFLPINLWIATYGSLSVNGSNQFVIKNTSGQAVNIASNSGVNFTDGSNNVYLAFTPFNFTVPVIEFIIAGNGTSTQGIKFTQDSTLHYLQIRQANGGGTTGFKVFAGNDIANSAITILENNPSGADLISTKTGTGTTVPIRFLIDTTEAARFDTSGNLLMINKTTKYNNISTAGWGIPAIYGSGRSTGQTGAKASVATYTVGASDGSFLVSANVNVTVSTTHSFNVQVDYTDETNTAQTLTLNFSQLAGTLINTITNVTGAGPYEGIPVHIRCKASTAITVKTTGTFTSLTYNAEGAITQIS